MLTETKNILAPFSPMLTEEHLKGSLEEPPSANTHSSLHNVPEDFSLKTSGMLCFSLINVSSSSSALRDSLRLLHEGSSHLVTLI